MTSASASGAFRITGAVGAALVLLITGSCDRADRRYATPVATYGTYLRSLSDEDAAAAWACFSAGYRQLEFGGSFERWQKELRGNPREMKRRAERREIAQERIINDKLAFLQFDPTTVPEREGPFFYFVRESEGWKITTHLDSLFRRELEIAIERGEFKLPPGHP